MHLPEFTVFAPTYDIIFDFDDGVGIRLALERDLNESGEVFGQADLIRRFDLHRFGYRNGFNNPVGIDYVGNMNGLTVGLRGLCPLAVIISNRIPVRFQTAGNDLIAASISCF